MAAGEDARRHLEFIHFEPSARSAASESGGWKLVGQASLPIACPEEPAGDEWDDARASSLVPPRISHGILLPEKASSLEAKPGHLFCYLAARSRSGGA